MNIPGQTPLVIWGAAGHAKVLAEFVEDLGYRIVAVFDNHPVEKQPIANIPVYTGKPGFESWRNSFTEQASCLVAIGGWRGSDRCALHEFMESHGLTSATAVHPRGWVARDAVLSPGCQVLAHAGVGAGAVLGKCCIINTGASVDHECVLGDGVHVAPGGAVAGCVTLEDFSFVGAGAVVLPRLRIGRNAIVGAGAVVIRDVPPGMVVAGNPARFIRVNA